jgi:8-oxo-dGTP diphosphatase
MAAIPVIDVACGVLINAQAQVLIAQRPPGKLAAGKWEFPGGKIESGETAAQALARELDEELGIRVRRSYPLLRFRHAYSDRHVNLDVHCVTGFDGQPQSREGQALRWMSVAAIPALDVLPTVAPILRALELPADYVFTPATDPAVVLPRLAALPLNALVRLRCPSLDDDRYAAIAGAFVDTARQHRLRPLLDRDPQRCLQLGAAGWHATQSRLLGLSARPLPKALWFAASVHDAAGLAKAVEVDADCVVLGPVQPTTTHPGSSVLGWDGFAALAAAARLPVYAIGGVGPGDLAAARQAGAIGIAGISAYW